MSLFAELPKQDRPKRDLPIMNLGAHWSPPAQLPSLKGVKVLGYDVETRDEHLRELGPGVHRPDSYIVGYSLSLDGAPGIYLPVRHQGGGNLDPAMVERWAKSELNAFDGTLVGARLIYDLTHSAKVGITFPEVKAFRDVLLAEPIIDEWKHRYNLDSVCEEHLGTGKIYDHARTVMTAYGWKTEEVYRANLWRLHARDVGEYASGDAHLPIQVLEKQVELLKADEQLHIFEMECELIPVLRDMFMTGVRVDLQRAGEVDHLLGQELTKWMTRLRHLAGPKANPNALASFANALRERGHIIPKTARGNDSVTGAWLNARLHDELCAAIAVTRRLDKIRGTFVQKYILERAVPEPGTDGRRGRVYAEFNQLKGEDENGNIKGTIVRFSSSNPNLQNLPSREAKADVLSGALESIGNMVRSIFVPEDGEEWQRDDLSQIELRYTVNYAIGPGADEAREAYIKDPGTDFHVLCGKMAGFDANDAKARKGVKNLNFARAYGAGDEKIAGMLGWTLSEAQEFIDRYDQALPFMKRTYQRCDESAATFGYVTTCIGRKCRFPLWEPMYNPRPKKLGLKHTQAIETYGKHIKRSDTYKAMNRKMQGSGAESMKKAMIDCLKIGLYCVIGPPRLTVHDELGNSIPRTKEGQEAGDEVTRIMESCIPGLKIPIICKQTRGANWGACG